MIINDKGYIDWEEYLKNPNPIDISYINNKPNLPGKTISDEEAQDMVDFLKKISSHIDEIIVEKERKSTFKHNLAYWLMHALIKDEPK